MRFQGCRLVWISPLPVIARPFELPPGLRSSLSRRAHRVGALECADFVPQRCCSQEQRYSPLSVSAVPSLFQLKDEPEGSEGQANWGRLLSGLILSQVSSRSRGGGNVGIGTFDFHISSALFPRHWFYAVSRSFSNNLLFACCMRRAASVSLRAPAMRFRALMLSPWRRNCAGFSSASRVSSGVW